MPRSVTKDTVKDLLMMEKKPDYEKPAIGHIEHYVCEPKGSTFLNAQRVIFIVAEDNNDGRVKYAASVFCRERNDETFSRSARQKIRETALGRWLTMCANECIDMVFPPRE